MKKNLSRLLSFVLVLLMVMTALPVSAGDAVKGGSELSKFGKWLVKPTPIGNFTHPAQSFTAELEDGTVVTVNAPVGALPAKTRMTAQAINNMEAVQAAVDQTDGVTGTVLTAVDITFTKGNTEVQPRKDVKVTISSDALSGMDDLSVVHLDVDADELEGSEDAEPVENAQTNSEGVLFSARHFSVYAVVEPGTESDHARLKVIFHGTEPQYEVYVTQQIKDYLASYIEDPEVPQPEGTNAMFCGWICNKADYTASDVHGARDINYVREQVKQRLNSAVHEGDEFHVYAMIFNVFSVSFMDENSEAVVENIIIRTRETSQVLDIEVPYVPYDNGYRFVGWEKENDSAVYENGSSITVDRNIEFSARVQAGSWLSFEENPYDKETQAEEYEAHKGGTYTAPKFCVNSRVTSAQRPADPVLAGYNFGGWYKDRNFATPFSFNETLAGDTTVYAKWTLKPSVPYTVIVWKQNVNDPKDAANADKTYDYAFSVTANVAPNTAISNLASSLSDYTGYAGNDNVEIDGEVYSFLGFKYRTYASADPNVTKVLPKGTTVINVYYDRELVTLRFYVPNGSYTRVTPDWSGSYSNKYYVNVCGGYYPVNTHTDDPYSYAEVPYDVSVTYRSSYDFYTVMNGYFRELSWSSTYRTWYFSLNGNTYYYDEGDFTRIFCGISTSTYYQPAYNLVSSREMTGLYGSTLESNDYVWQNDYSWYSEIGGSGTRTTFLDAFLPASTAYTVYYYGATPYGSLKIRFYKQNESGTTYNLANTVTAAAGSFNLSDKYNGFTCEKYSTSSNNGPWTEVGKLMAPSAGSSDLYYDADPTTPDTYDDIDYDSDLYILFKRNKYSINYMYGAFVDGNGVALPAPRSGSMNQESDIYYEADISGYEGTYEPAEIEGYVFLGWFSDPAGTKEYHFTDKTMPVDGVTVYAKFVQRQYRVFLHYDLAEGQTVVWADPDQEDNFRIDYEGKVSHGQRIEASSSTDGTHDYVLIGWYTDEACTQPYNFNTKLTDDTTVEYPDPIPSDQGRPWIDRKLDLYAKWRKKLPGASGINVKYLADESSTETGTFTENGHNYWDDPLMYVDSANTIGRSASTPDDDKSMFLYWIMLDKDGNEIGEPIYPGDDFTIDLDNAAEADAPQGKGGFGTRDVTYYEPVSDIEVGVDYLIGFKNGNDVYLLMNYNPNPIGSSNGYYSLDSNYYSYAVKAVTDSNGNVTGVSTDTYANAELANTVWQFVENGSYYRIQSGRSSSSYLGVFSSTTYVDLSTSSSYNTQWSWNSSTKKLSYSDYWDGTWTKYVTFNPTVGSYSNFFSAPASANSTYSTIQLYRVKTESTEPDPGTEEELVYGFFFETSPAAEGWSFIDSDGDGYNWDWNQNTSLNLNIYEGAGIIFSQSYINNVGALTPNNWAVSPQISIPTESATVSLYARGQGNSDYNEKFGFFIGTSNNTSEMEQIGSTFTVDNTYRKYSVDIPSSYLGKNVYIAIRHFNVTDMFILNVDQFEVYGKNKAQTKFEVTFKDYDGAILPVNGQDTQIVQLGEAAIPPAEPTRPGYIFNGWDRDFDNVTSDLVITATYREDNGKYVVTFVDFDGEILKQQEVDRGSSATPPADPDHNGNTNYVFKGWLGDYTNVQSDVTITAQYKLRATKVYTIRLKAVYGPKPDQPPTHITWYANNGTGDKLASENVLPNENIYIQAPEAVSGAKGVKEWEDLVWEEHEFLGWARLTEADYVGEDEIYLTEDDLFLKYVPETNSFLAHRSDNPEEWTDNDWIPVQWVAANENLPYHGMYAVWGTVIYVYHSADNTVEKVVTTKGNGNTVPGKQFFDITKYVRDGYLYGGYYKNYAGKSTGFEAKNVAANLWTAYTPVVGRDVDTKYVYKDNGTNAKPYISDDGTINVEWNWNESYNTDTDETKTTPDADGMHIMPVAGTTYYLKEVPDTMYLQPYLHYTYKLGYGEIKSAWLFSDIDDLNYNDTGFVIVEVKKGLEQTVNVANSVTISTQYGNSSVTLNPSVVFGSKNVSSGWLTYLQVKGGTNGITLTDNQVVKQYWKTPDGLYVTGTTIRSYTGLSSAMKIKKVETIVDSDITLN